MVDKFVLIPVVMCLACILILETIQEITLPSVCVSKDM